MIKNILTPIALVGLVALGSAQRTECMNDTQIVIGIAISACVAGYVLYQNQFSSDKKQLSDQKSFVSFDNKKLFDKIFAQFSQAYRISNLGEALKVLKNVCNNENKAFQNGVLMYIRYCIKQQGQSLTENQKSIAELFLTRLSENLETLNKKWAEKHDPKKMPPKNTKLRFSEAANTLVFITPLKTRQEEECFDLFKNGMLETKHCGNKRNNLEFASRVVDHDRLIQFLRNLPQDTPNKTFMINTVEDVIKKNTDKK